jgi:hypothetical protein
MKRHKVIHLQERYKYRDLKGPKYSNCLLWAIKQWCQKGGYLIVRKSHFGPIPHFIWSKDLKFFWSYQPIKPKWMAWNFPMFKGKVKIGK